MEAFLRSTHGCVQAKGLNPSSILQTFAVPAGRTPRAVSEPTNPLTTLPIVPSPPTAKTASFFSAAACFANSITCSPLRVSAASTLHPADSNSLTADLINGFTEKRPAVGLYTMTALRMEGLYLRPPFNNFLPSFTWQP